MKKKPDNNPPRHEVLRPPAIPVTPDIASIRATLGQLDDSIDNDDGNQDRNQRLKELQDQITRFEQLRDTQDISLLKEALDQDKYLRLARVPRGSSVLTIHHGGGKAASLKLLNDLLGMEGANEFIAIRKRVVKECMEAYGLISPDNHIASQYRTDTFSFTQEQRKVALTKTSQLPKRRTDGSEYPHSTIPPEYIRNANDMCVIDFVIRFIEKRMQAELQRAVLRKLPAAKKLLDRDSCPPGSIKRSQVEATVHALEDWVSKENQLELQLSFGLSEPLESDTMQKGAFVDRLAADAEALMTSSMHEERRSHGYNFERREKMGTTYDLAGIVVDIAKLKANIDRMPPQTKEQYFDTIHGVLTLKNEIITALRKGEIRKLVTDDQIAALLTNYYTRVNRFDIIRPWPDTAAWERHIQEKLAASSSNDIELVRQYTLEHYKNTGDVSEAEFHSRATRMPHCYNIVFDDVGMGNRQFNSCERAFWQMATEIESGQNIPATNYHETAELFAREPSIKKHLKNRLRDISLECGNDVTAEYYEKVRKAKAILIDTIQKKLARITHPDDIQAALQSRLVTSTHGGDEMFCVIALDTVPTWEKGAPVHLSNDEILHMLALIQRATGMRVAVTYKNIDGMLQATQSKHYSKAITEHQAALEGLDQGILYAKKFEKVSPLTPSQAAAGNTTFFAQKPNHIVACIIQENGELTVTPAQLALKALSNLAPQEIPSGTSLQKVIIDAVSSMIQP